VAYALQNGAPVAQHQQSLRPEAPDEA
jgi:hypothetical protein